MIIQVTKRSVILSLGFLCNSMIFYHIGLVSQELSYSEEHQAVNIEMSKLLPPPDDATPTTITEIKSSYKEDITEYHVDQESIISHYNAYNVTTELRNLFRTWTMVSENHFDYAVNSVIKLNENEVEGDLVEAGVWKGGMSMAMAAANQQDNTNRHLWLFDTFEGLPPPTSDKDDPKAKMVYEKLMKHNAKKEADEIDPEIAKRMSNKGVQDGKWNYGALDVVKNNMYYTGYPKDHIHFIKGKVEDTLYDTSIALPKKIALLRVDTDWYESTKAELEVLLDRLQSGGVFICDDYLAWAGARTAVDEYFKEKLGLEAKSFVQNKVFAYWKP